MLLDSGLEIAAGQRRRVLFVVDAAVVAAVRETGQPREIGNHLVAIRRIVHLQLRMPRQAWGRARSNASAPHGLSTSFPPSSMLLLPAMVAGDRSAKYLDVIRLTIRPKSNPILCSPM